MNKKAKIATIAALLVALAVAALVVYAAPKKCNNGIDDDNDGLADYPNDPGCSGLSDNDERSTALVCDNGLDATNDRDVLGDYRLSGGDPGCTSVTDPSEIDGVCDDLDDETNDRDTLTDSNDPGCTSTSDPSEIDGQCDDLSDNDFDGFSDYPTDPECSSYADIEGDCTDTDAFNLFVLGNVSGSFGGSPFSYSDSCVSSIEVKEWTCNGPGGYQPTWQNTNCTSVNATGCSNGACF